MTVFIEDIALRLAFEEVAADSENHDPLDKHLWENFTDGELRRLSRAADCLADRARRVRVRRHYDKVGMEGP